MSKYVIVHGQIYSADELAHYGVKGMKWGVRKSEYKSMNKQQRRAARRAFYDTPEGRQSLAATTKVTSLSTAVATALGGPLVGLPVGIATGFTTLGIMNRRANSLIGSKEALAGESMVNQMLTKETVRTYKEYESGTVTNIKKALTSKTPYYALSDKERNSITRSYEDRRASLIKQRDSAASPAQKQKIVDQLDELELDYLEIVERDW